MTDYVGKIEEDLAMTSFLGANRFTVPGLGAAAIKWRGASNPVPTPIGDFTVDGVKEDNDPPPWYLEGEDLAGQTYDRWNDADVWFDQAIVIPLVFAFGNILSTQTDTISIYSSYRDPTITLSDVVNNLGAGVNLPDLPTLPYAIQPQSGFTVTLEVTTEGSPTLDDTLDWVFNVGTIKVAITGSRIVMFPLPPEVPLNETLEFLTDLMPTINGKEQRITLRKNPRQIFDFKMKLDGNNRRYTENLLHDWQSRVFGLPIWTEPTYLTAAASAAATTIAVADTTLSDFRVGSLAIILTDRFTFDALEVQTIGAQSLEFTSPLSNSYTANTMVYPLRTALANKLIRGSRAFVNDEEFRIQFSIIDNDVGDSFASTGTFNTLNGRVLLDGPNATERRMTESLRRNLVVYDNETGLKSQASPWDRAKRNSVKGFKTKNRTDLWALRRLLHAFKGRLTAFYLPTFYNEMELTIKLQVGTTVLNIVNVGFSQFAKGNKPSRYRLRVHLTDGTIYDRTVDSASEVDSQNEQIVVDTAWPIDVEIEDVERIEYVELVRSDTDSFKIEHQNAIGQTRLFFPVKVVFDEL
ncbi:MAG: hypothetical protein KAR40_06020 [Candidatus Sabulitectum sp.]|nr:hypothetical protein [Candidatus Sabulitectum sp.]